MSARDAINALAQDYADRRQPRLPAGTARPTVAMYVDAIIDYLEQHLPSQP